MTEASDDELTAQFAQGQGESFTALFHRHYACAWRYAQAFELAGEIRRREREFARRPVAKFIPSLVLRKGVA